MRIAVDAMGGDFAPVEIVKGAVEASREWPDLTIVLVGEESAVRAELSACGATESERLVVRHASEVIAMCEPPSQAVRTKKDSSINRGMEMLRDKEIDAFLSAGSTGAMVAAGILIARRSPAVKRPAIATVFPTMEKPVLLLDAGANTDCSPVELEQFAIMGKIYAQCILGRIEPTIGLLSNGTEDAKGNALTKETRERLHANRLLDFVGNVEGHDIFRGKTDVIVCDGFVGNVVLKSIESLAKSLTARMKASFTANFFRKIGALLLKPAFRDLKKVMDPDVYGGAPLLGVNGTVIITHGASSHRAIFHAIRVAAECVRSDVAGKITTHLGELKATAAD